MRRAIWIFFLLVVPAAALAAWWAFAPPRVETVQPRRGEIAEIVYATGVVEPERWAQVSPLSRSRIVETCDCEGQEVKKGDVLARLDDSVEQATLLEMEARQGQASRELERALRLLERSVAAVQDVERARSEAAQADASVAAQRARIANLTLVAPTDGVVLRDDAEVGEIAEPAVALFWVGQPKPLIVTAEVNEEDILKVEAGQRVLLRSDAFPDQVLEATVSRITPKGDPVSKTFRVRFELPDDTPVRIGMTVDVNVVVRVAEEALLLPAAAINGDAVMVVTGEGPTSERAERKQVSVGIRAVNEVEILSGLSETERVISPFPDTIEDGDRVWAKAD
jgi:RND family efflux transporter MFP subunit